MLDAVSSIGAGAAVSVGGAMAGSVFGPIGTVVGGVTGGIIGSSVAAKISQFCSEWFFDLPKTAALEKAYAYLEVHHSVDNSAINQAYRRLALKYHPDKGGRNEDWLDLQISLQTITMAREDVF